MTMNAVILGLLAESPIHPGSGRGMGVVDLPVAREVATDYPVLVGSSLKGALRQKAEAKQSIDPERNFGKPDHAGDLLVSDGRLLLLPVRSLTGIYRWAPVRTSSSVSAVIAPAPANAIRRFPHGSRRAEKFWQRRAVGRCFWKSGSSASAELCQKEL